MLWQTELDLRENSTAMRLILLLDGLPWDECENHLSSIFKNEINILFPLAEFIYHLGPRGNDLNVQSV